MAAGTIITRKGVALMAKLLASRQSLTFTRAAVGTGSAPSGYDPAGMANLNQYKMDGEISGYSVGDGEASVIFQISSGNVNEGFTITEAGLFAEDGDEGEVLYAYLDLTGDPQYVYSKDSAIQKFAEIEFKTIIGSIERVTAVVAPSALVTKEVYDEGMKRLETPEFDDSGEVEGIGSFPDFLVKVKSKMNFFQFFRDFKAGMKFVLHAGDIINNCESEDTDKPLSAAQGKELMDLYTQLHSKTVADEHVAFVTLTAEGWTGSAAPYSQTVQVDGAKEGQEPVMVSALEDGATLEEQKAYIKAYGILCSGTGTIGEGTATFKVYKKPDINITVGLRGVMG